MIPPQNFRARTKWRIGWDVKTKINQKAATKKGRRNLRPID
jgi:hypothetical protein